MLQGNFDMILALRGLNFWILLESCADRAMPDVSSGLGKRLGDYNDEVAESSPTDQAMVVRRKMDPRDVQQRYQMKNDSDSVEGDEQM
jgi:hypothetical protein